MYVQNIELLSKSLLKLQGNDRIQGLLLFGSSNNKIDTVEMKSVLELNHIPLIGGFFPEIIAGGERKREGFLLIPLFEKLDIVAFDSINSNCMQEYLENEINNSSLSINSVFCFVNAFWEEKNSLILNLYNILGPFVSYIGGGAGSIDFESFPCVFANQKIIENGAVVGLSQKQISLGVAHGWLPISEPIKVTEADENRIISLNWKPAFNVYQDLIKLHSNKLINEQNFFEIAKSYPLGLVKLDDEMIIRDPYATEKGCLKIVDKVPQGDYIRIMNGNMVSLLEGAQKAVQNASLITEYEIDQLCIDCISRVLFMKDDFQNELDCLNQIQKTNGILSIGEIANPINSPLELFNKTVVVAQWIKKI